MIKCQTQRRKTSPQNYLARGGGYDDDSPLTAAGLAASKSAEISADMAAKRFAAPSSYDRSVYNDPSAMPRYKEQVFQQGAKVTSTATGQTLVRTQAEAKAIYGDEWTLHSMETDHIVPVKQVHEQLKDNPFLTNEDRREIANIQENFRVCQVNCV